MNLLELKKFLNTLPEEFDTYDLVNGEFVDMLKTEYHYRVDQPIESITVDEETKEICFLHQTQDEIIKITND